MDLKIWTSRQGHNDLVCYWVLILIRFFSGHQYNSISFLHKCIYEYIKIIFDNSCSWIAYFKYKWPQLNFPTFIFGSYCPKKNPKIQTARFVKFVYSFPGSSLPVEAFYVKHDVTLTSDLIQIKRNMMQWIGMRNEHYIIFSMPLFDGH